MASTEEGLDKQQIIINEPIKQFMVKRGLAYKIAPDRAKKYATHYNIVPDKCLIVPVRIYDGEVSCDIRWEEDDGGMRLLQNKIFISENLIPLNAMHEFELYALWKHHYETHSKDNSGFDL